MQLQIHEESPNKGVKKKMLIKKRIVLLNGNTHLTFLAFCFKGEKINFFHQFEFNLISWVYSTV